MPCVGLSRLLAWTLGGRLALVVVAQGAGRGNQALLSTVLRKHPLSGTCAKGDEHLTGRTARAREPRVSHRRVDSGRTEERFMCV